MASSQRDMFLDSSPENSPKVDNSLPAPLAYIYLWVILFDWDEDVEQPFDVYQIATFSNSDLRDEWISGELDENSRLKKLKFASIRGKTMSLFAKVEKCE